MDISTQLKQKREALHLTQQQVADKVFVTRQTISKWELGKSQPDLVSLKLLKNVLQLDDLDPDGAKNAKGDRYMKPTLSWKDLLFTLFFGILFLPIRLLYTVNLQHKHSKFVKFFVKPILLGLFFLYIGSLNTKALLVITALTVILYYTMTLYYTNE